MSRIAFPRLFCDTGPQERLSQFSDFRLGRDSRLLQLTAWKGLRPVVLLFTNAG
jgi:hypothetical protein